MIGRIILMGSCDLNLRMGGRIDISNREREWPGNNDSPNEHLVGVPISLVLVVAKRKRFQVVDDQINQQERSLVALLKMTYLHWFSLKKRALSQKPNVLVLACLLRNTNAESKKSLG